MKSRFKNMSNDEILAMRSRGCIEDKTELFQLKMKIIHPTYDFSEFVYQKNNIKGTYYCDNPEHDAREASPNHLLRGVGCSACVGLCPVQAKKDFFIKMKKIHPTYDFSEFVYQGALTKGTYYCDNPEHDARKAIPSDLLKGVGCLKCAGSCPVQAEKDFFVKMKIMHPTYDFSEFVYKGAMTKGTYYCDVPEHGPRKAVPSSLLNGRGCLKCAGKCPVQAEKDFFEKMKIMHPTYNFSEFVYQGAMTKGTYFCDNPEHGPRKAIPSDLLNGHGCSMCNKTHRVQQKKIFKALQEEFPFLDWQWEKRYPCMLNTEFDISALLPSGELVAVEYDGEQHYRPVNFGGRSVELSDIAFIKQQKDDKIKDKRAADNNINLFRIPYFDWQENQNDTLHELFGNIEDLI